MSSLSSRPSVGVVWTLVPERAPTVTRRCPRCETAQPFAHTGRFRINGNGRRVDVWLIYGCSRCEFTWKLTVFTRVLPASIGPNRYRRFQENDLAEADAVAADLALLSRAGVRPDPVAVRIDGPGSDQLQTFSGWISARVREPPAPLRLERLLTRQLGISRSALARHIQAGAVVVTPEDKRAWRRPAHSKQRYLLDADRLWPRQDPPVAASSFNPA